MKYTIKLQIDGRAKRVSLRITPYGEVLLRVPKGVDVRRALAWCQSNNEHIEQTLRDMAEQGVLRAERTKEEIEALRKVAKVKIRKALDEASAKSGIGYNRLSIRATRSRWGSCSSEGNISLSLYLAELPDELIEFICLHELCHRLHPNHSPEFHTKLNQLVDGREKELLKMLKKHRIG